MYPNGLDLSPLYLKQILDYRNNVEEGFILDAIAIELDFQTFEPSAFYDGLFEVVPKVFLHFGLFVFEVAIPIGFERELLDGIGSQFDFQTGDVIVKFAESGWLKERGVFGEFADLVLLHTTLLECIIS